jgi:hypothetical protein
MLLGLVPLDPAEAPATVGVGETGQAAWELRDAAVWVDHQDGRNVQR